MTQIQFALRIRGWYGHPGWVVASLRKSWFVVGDRQTKSRDIAETWFARGSMTEDEVVITALLEIARAMKDDLSG